jgi:hypothetical protein
LSVASCAAIVTAANTIAADIHIAERMRFMASPPDVDWHDVERAPLGNTLLFDNYARPDGSVGHSYQG